jgi:hypothetical protein
MAGSSIMLRKAYKAAGAIGAYLIVKPGADDASVVVANAATDALMGTNDELARAVGENADIVKMGIAPVRFGGVVTRGDALTSDGAGRAITAVPAPGANARIIGFAEVSAVADDIGPYLVSPGRIQG